MNKVLKIAAVASIGLFLTGCGAKKITCSRTQTDSYYGEESEKIAYEFDKSGENLVKVTQTFSVKYTDKYLEYMDDEYDEDLDDVLEEAEEDCEDYEDNDFTTCKVSKKGNAITQTVTYKLKDLSKKDLEEMYDDDDISSSVYYDLIDFVSVDYDDIKKDSQDSSNHYNCK